MMVEPFTLLLLIVELKTIKSDVFVSEEQKWL